MARRWRGLTTHGNHTVVTIEVDPDGTFAWVAGPLHGWHGGMASMGEAAAHYRAFTGNAHTFFVPESTRLYETEVDADGIEAGPTPGRCPDCDRPTFYDDADDSYHHAVDAGTGCFLLPAETDLPDDTRHPLHPLHP